MKKHPKVSIVVPTRNSIKNMELFFNSSLKSTYKDFEIIVNDDIVSSDGLLMLTKKKKYSSLDITYVQRNLSMAQGRKTGSTYAKGQYLLHLDSDMQITDSLIGECVANLDTSYDALVVPEVSIGSSFWARVKALEKEMYQNVPQIQSIRAIKSNLYDDMDGHNPDLVFSEDKDLHLRLEATNSKIGHTKAHLIHNEGSIKLWSTLVKKLGYADTADNFADLHPTQYRWQANPFNRYLIFIKNWRLLFSHPIQYIALYWLKTWEYVFSFIAVVGSKVQAIKKARILLGTLSNWYRVIPDKLGMSKTTIYKTRSGSRALARAKSPDVNELVVCMSGFEYPKEYLQIEAGATVLDLGGNIGSFCLYFDEVNSGKTYNGHTFEPFADNYSLLNDNLELNGITNFASHKMAISDIDGTVNINDKVDFDAVHITDDKAGTPVESQRLSTFCKKHGIKDIDLLKIDIEGGEYPIVDIDAKFIKDHVSRILIEYHDEHKANGKDWILDKLGNAFDVKSIHIGESNGVLLMENKR